MSKAISGLPAAARLTGSDKQEVTQSSTSKANTIQQVVFETLGVTATGTDTYAATFSPVHTAYVTNYRYFIKFTNANTGAATLNIDGLGAKAIKKSGATALSSGDIAAGQVLELVYDGTNFQVVGGGGSGGIGGSTGSVDNAALRADGTGGSTVQSSACFIDDSGNITLGTSAIAGPKTITTIASGGNGALRLIPEATLGAGVYFSNVGIVWSISNNSAGGYTHMEQHYANGVVVYEVSVGGKVKFKAGTSTGVIVAAGGVIKTNTTQTGNGAGATTDLFSYTVPANALATDGDTLRATYSGRTAANGNSKTFAIVFGGTTIFTAAIALNNADWTINVEIIRTGGATQKCIVSFLSSGQIVVTYTATTITLSATAILKMTGNGAGASDIIGEMSKVRWEPSE